MSVFQRLHHKLATIENKLNKRHTNPFSFHLALIKLNVLDKQIGEIEKGIPPIISKIWLKTINIDDNETIHCQFLPVLNYNVSIHIKYNVEYQLRGETDWLSLKLGRDGRFGVKTKQILIANQVYLFRISSESVVSNILAVKTSPNISVLIERNRDDILCLAKTKKQFYFSNFRNLLEREGIELYASRMKTLLYFDDYFQLFPLKYGTVVVSKMFL